ncbi:hypothetical protein B0T22DRAFT_516741 [Podospora appendiculata]|uniref:Uncharacterized protein n=1 Tax=Podospora appendiculata TaxID=314037 RepID=A0AAE0X4J7_9PEZI|nr:hypothetical protein B0T22DRAFT_516741 [Podospora appendiculata]
MSDLTWLRGFQRSHVRSPVRASDDSAASTSPEKAADRHHHTSPIRHHRVRPAAAVQRVSSLLNLNLGGGGGRESRSASLSGPISLLPLRSTEGPRGGDDGGRGGAGQGEATWYNPTTIQVVETLQTAMMGRSDPLEPIPIRYNSSVLRLIEAFGNLTRKLRDNEQELSELKTLRAKELEQFREVSEDWMERESGYKAEIKRLEVVLAKESKDGVASVALARHGSLVDRSATKRFHARLKRLSNSQDQGIFAASYLVLVGFRG